MFIRINQMSTANPCGMLIIITINQTSLMSAADPCSMCTAYACSMFLFIDPITSYMSFIMMCNVRYADLNQNQSGMHSMYMQPSPGNIDGDVEWYMHSQYTWQLRDKYTYHDVIADGLHQHVVHHAVLCTAYRLLSHQWSRITQSKAHPYGPINYKPSHAT